MDFLLVSTMRIIILHKQCNVSLCTKEIFFFTHTLNIKMRKLRKIKFCATNVIYCIYLCMSITVIIFRLWRKDLKLVLWLKCQQLLLTQAFSHVCDHYQYYHKSPVSCYILLSMTRNEMMYEYVSCRDFFASSSF